MDHLKILAMPLLMLLGVVLRRLGMGTKAPKLEKLIICFTYPLLVLTEILRISASATVAGTIPLIAFLSLSCLLVLSLAETRGFPRRSRGTVILNSTFISSMFLPFPIIYAFYEDLSVAVLFSFPFILTRNTFGVILASHFGKGGDNARALLDALKFPPLLAFIVGACLLPFSEEIRGFGPVFEGLHTAGLLTVYLSLLLIGLYVPIPKRPKEFLENPASNLITINRMLLSPLPSVVLVLAFGLEGLARNTILIMSVMPPAITNVIIASRFNLDVEVTSQSTFTLSFLSVGLVFLLKFLEAI